MYGVMPVSALLISIHALLAESDQVCICMVYYTCKDFYPRSPCGERPSGAKADSPTKYFYPRSPCGERQHAYQLVLWVLRFLSTLSLRRATSKKSPQMCFIRHFYPRSPCGERRESPPPCERPTRDFYPRSPCGERLYDTYAKVLRVNISIHALLAESDAPCSRCHPVGRHISIHALLAESDQFIDKRCELGRKFLSTLSLRRATTQGVFNLFANPDFYPRSPCGERQADSVSQWTAT